MLAWGDKPISCNEPMLWPKLEGQSHKCGVHDGAMARSAILSIRGTSCPSTSLESLLTSPGCLLAPACRHRGGSYPW